MIVSVIVILNDYESLHQVTTATIAWYLLGSGRCGGSSFKFGGAVLITVARGQMMFTYQRVQ